MLSQSVAAANMPKHLPADALDNNDPIFKTVRKLSEKRILEPLRVGQTLTWIQLAGIVRNGSFVFFWMFRGDPAALVLCNITFADVVALHGLLRKCEPELKHFQDEIVGLYSNFKAFEDRSIAEEERISLPVSSVLLSPNW